MSTDEQKADVVERLQRGVQEYEVRWAKHDAPIRHWDIGGADDAMREAATLITALHERIKELEGALRNIAEGNLGDQPWQASYDRIREVAVRPLKDSGNGSEVA